uniref:Si:ch211-201h21.5 n=1 Tax=Amphiprion percula TaxID=161767 RepID=A0A3P8TYV9_AMPPE
MAKKLLIIDTDCGIDDAQAIMMALAAPDVEVLGITCVFGNTAVENVCQNVLKVLSVCDFFLQIPVFRGSAGPLVGPANTVRDHFGTDGLGDVLKDKDPRWEEKIQREHAVSAMIRLVSENQNQVSLMAIGPLTNLALAVRLDPGFPQKLKDLYIMGGNMEGKGNVTLCAEFNFAMDPESAYIVLEEFLCTTYIASDCWAYSKEAMVNRETFTLGPCFVSYDAYAMAACIDSSVLTEKHQVSGPSGAAGLHRSVFVMTKCDCAKLSQLLLKSLRQPCRK